MEDLDDVFALMLVYAQQDVKLQQLREQIFELELGEEWKRLMRARHYLTTDCLLTPAQSSWAKLYADGTDLNFLNMTSLTRAAFDRLLETFSAFYIIPPPSRLGGRPRKFRYHHQALGLVLHYYVTSGDQHTLCTVFGAPPSTVSRVLSAAELALAKALVGFAPARVSWQSPQCQARHAALIAAKEPILQYTFGFIDGKNLRVQEPSNADLQNAMYNGWLHAVFVTGTLCFAADGCIIWYRHNCPGSWNDADTSGGFRDRLLDPEKCPDQRYGVVSDSAFPCSGSMVGRILTPLKDKEIDRILPSRRPAARRIHNAITSIRQAAEWGMGSVAKVYHRLYLPLPYDPRLRGVRIDNMFRLVNYRVRSTGISQIRTTFARDMELPDL